MENDFIYVRDISIDDLHSGIILCSCRLGARFTWSDVGISRFSGGLDMNYLEQLQSDLRKVADDLLQLTALEDSEALFYRLAKIQEVKDQFKSFQNELDVVESDVKSIIKDKALTLYGSNWTAIKGSGYKITRSRTGAVYEEIGKALDKFINIKRTVDAELVDVYVAKNGKLPAHITVNEHRGESIQIKVNLNENH